MDRIAAALGDTARWRIVELLAERPRSVGELAELTGLRQPQTTKHLQTLARTGLATVFPLGQRPVSALEPRPDGRAVLEYRDAEGRYRSEGRVHAAKAPEHLGFDLSVLDAAGAIFFTGHYDLTLTEAEGGTRLRLGLCITETTPEA